MPAENPDHSTGGPASPSATGAPASPSATTASPAGTGAFRERVFVPLSWWLIALLFVVSVFVAIAFYLGPVNGALIAGLAACLVAAVLVPYGSLRTTVDDAALTVGPNRIEWRWVAEARALDAEATRRRMGPEANARAHLATRPYVHESVEVTLDDPADPHPYWLVSTRHAPELAAAIQGRLRPRPSEDRHDDA